MANGLKHMVVYHDDSCPCSSGTRSMMECTCQPDFRMVEFDRSEQDVKFIQEMSKQRKK